VCSNEEPRHQVDRLTGGRARVTNLAPCDCGAAIDAISAGARAAADPPNAEVNRTSVGATAPVSPAAVRRSNVQPGFGWRIARKVSRDYRA
jgi:hypothetical protein